MVFEYEAVPWPAGADDPQPAVRAALAAEGFRLLGGCRVTQAGRRAAERLARGYGPEHRAEFTRWVMEPGQVFSAPDGTAYAQLGWLWECRYAGFTTVLADGRILQTFTSWDADPVWPKNLASQYARTTTRHDEQLVLATDLDAVIVDGEADGAWAVHRERVASVEGPVPDHSRLEDFVRIHAAESRAREAWARRVRIVAFVLAFAAVTVPFAVVTVLLGEQPWWVDAGAVLVAVLVCLAIYVQTWLRVRRWRGLRPRFRAPVPGLSHASQGP